MTEQEEDFHAKRPYEPQQSQVPKKKFSWLCAIGFHDDDYGVSITPPICRRCGKLNENK